PRLLKIAGMSAALGWAKERWLREDEARGHANEADFQGCHEARGGDRSVTGKDFAQPARRHQSRFVLESDPAVARRRDPKSLDRSHASAQSNFANDCEMDIAHA